MTYLNIDPDGYALEFFNVDIKNTTFLNSCLIFSKNNLNLSITNSIISNNTMITTNSNDSLLLHFISAQFSAFNNVTF